MSSNRIGRINEEIQRELAALIPTVKDPRVADAGMISVTAVETTPDLKYAKIYVSVLDKSASAQALKELLAEGPITIQMHDYGNFEKVGPLGQSLPTNNEQIHTQAGDLILYQGDQFVIYYDTNTWNFTRLGRINHVSAQELREVLGDGDVSVTLSIG